MDLFQPADEIVFRVPICLQHSVELAWDLLRPFALAAHAEVDDHTLARRAVLPKVGLKAQPERRQAAAGDHQWLSRTGRGHPDRLPAPQRCWAHKMRNILERVRKRGCDAVKAGAQAIYLAQGRRQAEAAFRAFARRWKSEYPAMVRRLERDLPELLASFAFP